MFFSFFLVDDDADFCLVLSGGSYRIKIQINNTKRKSLTKVLEKN